MKHIWGNVPLKQSQTTSIQEYCVVCGTFKNQAGKSCPGQRAVVRKGKSKRRKR